jgi:flagellar protein FlbT
MNITLRAGERFFINGAVIRIDRKASIELLNEVTFLLENHVMQAEEAGSSDLFRRPDHADGPNGR